MSSAKAAKDASPRANASMPEWAIVPDGVSPYRRAAARLLVAAKSTIATRAPGPWRPRRRGCVEIDEGACLRRRPATPRRRRFPRAELGPEVTLNRAGAS